MSDMIFTTNGSERYKLTADGSFLVSTPRLHFYNHLKSKENLLEKFNKTRKEIFPEDYI